MNRSASHPVFRWLGRALLLAALLCGLTGAARAQLYVLQNSNNTLGTYNASTGAPINATFITAGLSNPQALVLSGNFLFVVNYASSTVGKYNATTGATINANFITGLQGPQGLALSGNRLFVGNFNNSTVGVYDATTGAVINAAFITGLSGPTGVIVSGNNLYVSKFSANTVGKYDATTGAAINASFITGLGGAGELGLSGNSLFVSNYSAAKVGKYDATTGAAINANFITGISGPTGSAVAGNVFFALSNSGNTVGKYDATSGAAINAAFITGLHGPVAIALAAAGPAGPTGQLPTATVGTNPSAVAVNPITNRVYVANQGSDNISVLDGASFQVVDSFPAGAAGCAPVALVFHQATGKLYVANSGAGAGGLNAIDVSTHVATPISTTGAVTAVGLNPITGTVYAIVPTANKIVAVNPNTFATTSMGVNDAPTSLAINPVTNTVYVGTNAFGVTVVNGATLAVVHTASTDQIGAVAVNPITNLAYAIDNTTGSVQVIDGATTNIVATIPVGPSLGSLAVNPVTNKIYVSLTASNGVTVIDGLTRATLLLDVGLTTRGLAINASTNRIYFGSPGEAHLAVLDGSSNQVSIVSTGGSCGAIGINPITNRVYVALPAAGQVDVLDGDDFSTATLAGISSPKVAAIDPSTNRIYIGGGNASYAIDGDTRTVENIGNGLPKLDAAVDPATQKVYAITQGGNSLKQFDARTGVVASTDLSDPPFALALDPSLGRVYVALSGSAPRGSHPTLASFDGLTPAGSLLLTGAEDIRFAVNPATHKIYALTSVDVWISLNESLGEREHSITNGGPVSLTAGNGPFVAVNPVTNKIYMVLYGDGVQPGQLLVIDGALDAQEALINMGVGASSVAVNSVTNQIYVANSISGSLTIVDGATNLPTEYPLGAGAHPVAVAVDSASDRAYVASGNGEVDIFVRTVYLRSLTGLGTPSGVVVNPVSGKAYVLDRTGNQVIEITPAPQAPSQLAAFVSRLPGDAIVEPFAEFTLGGVRAYSSAPVPASSLYYQVDTMEGPWQSALSFGGAAMGFAHNLTFGYHTLYAFAADSAGLGSDPVGSVAGAPVSRIASYTFLDRPGAFSFATPAVQVTPDAGSVSLTVQRDFTDPATVNFETVDGSALGGVSYTAVQGTLSFDGGETAKSITVPLLTPPSGTPSGSFSVRLFAPGGGRVGTPGVAAVTVVNGQAEAAVTIPPPNQIAPQPAPNATSSITVNLTPPEANGQWRLFGERAWRDSGAVATGLVAANYSIEFKPVSNFTQPARLVTSLLPAFNLHLTEMYGANGPAQTGLLTVTFSPAETGGWRLQGEANFRPSGGTPLSLNTGSYTLEFQPVNGRATPPSQAVTIQDNHLTAVTTTYLIADALRGAVPALVDDTLTRTASPYEFLGQIQTDEGFGTGFVPLSRSVATAAHVLFDDGTLSYVTGVRWFFQHELGVFEAPPQIPRGTYLFAGYATQRATDASPGVSTAASRQLDAAALYFLEPAGRGGASGILASNSAANPWLLGRQPKLITGYPVDVVATPGRLFATPAVADPLSFVSGALFKTNALTSYAGNSGGPLCVLFSDGKYYPAAIYLGGTDQTIVRAIDRSVVDLLQRAEASGQGGPINVGAGIAHLNLGLTGNTALSLGSVRADLGPAGAVAAGAGWRLAAESSARASGQPALGLLAGTYQVTFTDVTGYTTPPAAMAIVAAGTETVVTGTYVPVSVPTISSPLIAQAIAGQSFSYQIAATIDPDRFTATPLPFGLHFDATTGLLSGALPGSALAGSPYTIALGAHNSLGDGPSSNLVLSVQPAGQLTVSVSGKGSVPKAFTKTSVRAVGSAVSIQATPAAGNLFESWRDAQTGAVLSTQALYRFNMPPQLSLQATFVADPFVAGQGTYLGLVQGETFDLAGLVKVSVTHTGRFTAAGKVGGSTGSINNLFDHHGHYEGSLALASGPIFQLTLDLTSAGTLSGIVTDTATGRQVPLLAARALTKAPKALVASYTAQFPLAAPDPALPGGTGFCRFGILANGGVTVSGVLGDGKPFSSSSQLDLNNSWPLFLLPTSGGEAVFGVVSSDSSAPPTFAGSAKWLRAPAANDPLAPNGFSTAVTFSSSRFTAPAIRYAGATITFSGGDLQAPLPKSISFNPKGQTASGASPGVSIALKTGLFSGAFMDGATSRTFQGVVLQSTNSGAGLFPTDGGQTGAVLLRKQ